MVPAATRVGAGSVRPGDGRCPAVLDRVPTGVLPGRARTVLE
ncbi:MAG TPA: hypothetical protein VK816_01020 [Jatrophihabitantaceae bacterium]|nr:hypothetical protein [Jatrophihabitantaceae bacterium]